MFPCSTKYGRIVRLIVSLTSGSTLCTSWRTSWQMARCQSGKPAMYASTRESGVYAITGELCMFTAIPHRQGVAHFPRPLTLRNDHLAHSALDRSGRPPSFRVAGRARRGDVVAVAMAVQEQAQPGKDLDRRSMNLVFITVLLGMLLSALDQTVVSTALPTIVGDLGGAGHLTWVVSSYLLADTIATVLAGKFGDLFGRKLI